MLKIYVGNLNYQTTEDSLYSIFGEYGQVSDVQVIADRETGRPRGFAFVEMANDDEGQAAIEALHGSELDGRTLTVNEARPREPRGGGFGGGGGGGGRRGGGGFSRGGGGRRGGPGGGGRGRW